MKKFVLTAMVMCVAIAAQAEATYQYVYEFLFSKYMAKDTNPGADHASWYSCYAMTQETAQDLLDKTSSVDYSSVAKWLGSNFADNSAALKDVSQSLTIFHSYKSSDGEYYFENMEGDPFDDVYYDYIGVVLFSHEGNLAYNVFGAPTEGTPDHFLFDATHAGSPTSGWIAVTDAVPEPTSGMLMLLGIAGLALKRKRA